MRYEKMSACEKREAVELFGIAAAAVLLVYLLLSFYFTSHFFFHTTINGADLSLKSAKEADQGISTYVDHYMLILVERDDKSEKITGQQAGLTYKNRTYIKKALYEQNALHWLSSLFRTQELYAVDLFSYDESRLKEAINSLDCFKQKIIEPENVSYIYLNGHYQLVKEVYGNYIKKENLEKAAVNCLLRGETKVDLEACDCYKNPVYTMNSPKVFQTLRHLNNYVSSRIIYLFGSKREVVDGNVIQNWITVDKNLDAVIDKGGIGTFVKELGKKYNTVGIKRDFITSSGTRVQIEGGIYGWKIDQEGETEALTDNIITGRILMREPVYTQKAVSRAGNEIGKTYVEINITRQHLWFYKDGWLVVQGPVVTGNPNRGNPTVTGAFKLNYKQEGAVLTGQGYEAGVRYWMPFYGNIGIHDARWRHAFGGEIYKNNGTHGCVNAPYYLAEIIYKNIEAGVPVICYQEAE